MGGMRVTSMALIASACLVPGCSEDGSGRGGSGASSASGVTAADSETGGDTADSAGDEGKFDVGGGETDGATAEGGKEDCEEDIDIVFVLDVSTSMTAYLTTLADEILVVDTAIKALPIPSPPQYGLVVFVDDTMILNMGAPYTDAVQLQADFRTWSQFTASNQQVGGGNANTTWPENSLDALFLGSGGYQWRPADGTAKIIIHATDDTFWDGPTTGNGVMIQHGYTDTVAQLQDQKIRVFSFAAAIGGPLSDQDVTPGWSSPYMGEDSIPDATDGGVFSIDQVLAGMISLSEAINGAVEGKHCVPYPPPG